VQHFAVYLLCLSAGRRNLSRTFRGAAYIACMVFLLVGGPRARQLVDDLPRGYRRVDPKSGSGVVTLLEDLVVEEAVWTGSSAYSLA